MMRYMGSKSRIAKHIAPIMMRGHDKSKPYVEPFVGGGNMIDKVPAPIRWGSDKAEYAVAFLQGLANGWTPPETLSEEAYKRIKENPSAYPSALVGFAAYACSFGGKFWGGYARGAGRDLANEQYRASLNCAGSLIGVKFRVCGYLDAEYPNGSTVYMDPPYAGTTGYNGDFDHDQFWRFSSDLSKRCRVFVSEYTAPPNWLPIWEKEQTSSLTKNTGAKRGVEKLFTCRQ